MSIICRIRCDGSKLSPIVSPHCSRMRRHMRGVVAMLWPPGHSSQENSIGQFSRVILRPWSRAKATMSGQISSARSQFWSWSSAPSPPMNVLTSGEVHLLGRLDDLLEVADDRVAVLGVGMERVRVEAQAGDGQALGLDLGPDVRGLPGRQVRDVDVARARVAAGRAGGLRPAGDLEDLEAGLGGPVGHLHEGRVRERRGQEPELHRAASVMAGWAAATLRAVDGDPATLAGAPGDGLADEHLVVAVGERGVAGAGGGRPGYHVRVDGPEMRAEGVEEALDVTARQGRRGLPGRAHQGGVADEDLVGPVAVAHARPGRAAPSPTPTSRRCRRSRTASEFFRPALIWEMLTAPRAPPSKRSRIVAASSVAMSRSTVSAERSVENVSTGPVGSWRVSMNVARSAITVGDVLAGHEGHQVQPVRADVADRAQGAAALRLEPPVPVAVEEQPVLEVAPGDEPDVAEAAAADELVGVLVERVVADVEVGRVDQAGLGGPGDQRGRLAGGHGQRLLAHDVLAGVEDRQGLAGVQVVGRGDVDDLDGGIGQQRRRGPRTRAGRSGASARAAPRSGVLPRTPRTSTPMRRRASTWTVPMKPVPMTAAPMSASLRILVMRAPSETV